MLPRKQLLAALEYLARQLNILIRYEKTAARGGLCLHNGQHQIIIDRKATDAFKIDVITNAVTTFDLSGIYLSPKLRDLFEIL